MIKDIITYDEKKYQVSTVSIYGLLETMIFPINNGIVSGREVYCFRTGIPGESMKKHKDILHNPEKYISYRAITKYLREKATMYETEETLDRRTALRVLQDLSSCMYPNVDLFGNKTLVIGRCEFEKIRAKYLDQKG